MAQFDYESTLAEPFSPRSPIDAPFRVLRDTAMGRAEWPTHGVNGDNLAAQDAIEAPCPTTQNPIARSPNSPFPP